MRGMREGSTAVGGSMAAGRERLSARKMECSTRGGEGGSSGKLRVFESRKEKKRRLVLSDSESEDLVSPHRRRAVAQVEKVDVKGDGSGGRKLEFEGFMKNGKRAGVTLKRVVQQDVVRHLRDSSIGLNAVHLGIERKRSQEVARNSGEDDEVSLKRIKRESLIRGKDKRREKNVERLRLESVRCGVGKALVRASHLPSPKQLVAADEGHESLDTKRMHVQLNGNRSFKDGKNSCLGHPNQKIYGSTKHSISSSDAQQCSVSSDGRSFRLQGKGGVLRLFPGNNKSAGDSTYCFGNEPDENWKNTRNSDGTYKGTFSEGKKSIKKSGSSSIAKESRKDVQCLGGADLCSGHPSLSDNRKLLRKAGSSSTIEESGKSSGRPSSSNQTIMKHVPLFKDRKVIKKKDSLSAKEENRKRPQNSTGSIQVKRSSMSEDRVSLKKSGSSMSVARKYPRTSSCSPPLSEDRESLKNPGSSSTQRKCHVRLKGKGLELKKEADDLPPQRDSKITEKLSKRTEVKESEASRSITKTPATDSTTSENLPRSTEKQKLRDHIKSMLLSAGWRIEMRPRRGRNYEDAVYVTPQGTGYWSITKAYNVLQEQFNAKEMIENGEGKELHGQLSKASFANACNRNGIAPQFSAIPADMLEMLKRKVVQKRKGRIEENKGKSTKTKGRVGVAKKGINDNGINSSSRKRNKNGRGCTLLARTSKTEADSDDDGYVPYAGKRSVLAWMIDSGTVSANKMVKYMNKRHTRTMLDGSITRDGILCSCCSKILTVSKFEIHAGSKLNQPYANILLEESGVSLLQCQLDAWKTQKESDRCAFQLIDITDDDPNDDTCGICGDGGDLMCCDSCPSTFHLSCLDIQMVPPGEWHCTNCLCRFCGVANSSTTEDSGVTGPLLLSCGQCEGKYHEACTSDVVPTPVDTNNSPSLSFCGQDCRMLFERLQNLLGVKNDLDAGFSWTLVRRFDDESLTSCSNLTQWAECNSKVAVALAVMNECFLRIIDRRSGINLIHNVLYNRRSNFSRLSYGGFYTFVLERGDEIISAASIRIRGTKVAEMPFIGTRDMYRRQGMCRQLLNVIEVTLGTLKIKKLVIPAISELMHTWTAVFGFKPLDNAEKGEMKSLNMLVFPDTGLLQKPLLGPGSNTIKEGGSDPTENDTSTVPNGSSDLCTSDDGIVPHSVEIMDETGISKIGFPASNRSVHATPELYPTSDAPSDAPCKSDPQAVRYKSLETALDGPSSVACNVASHDTPCGGIESKNLLACDGLTSDNDEVQSQDTEAVRYKSLDTADGSSSVDCNVGDNDTPRGGIEPKNLLACDGLASVNTEVRILDSVTHLSVPTVDKLPIQHSSDVIGESLGTPTSFQDVGEKALHVNSGYLGHSSDFRSQVASDDTEVQRHDSVAHSCVPMVDKLSMQPASDIIGKSFDTSTSFQDAGEKILHVYSGCMGNLPEFGSEEIHHNSSDVANKSSLAHVSSNRPAVDVATVPDTHNNEGEAYAPDGDLLNCDSHLNPEAARVPLEDTVSMSCTGADSSELNLHRSDDPALFHTGKAVVEVPTVKNETCVSCNDPLPCTNDVSASQVEVVRQVNTCKDVECEISENTNHNECSQSDDGLQVSDHCLYKGSELPQ